ncbi:MAG: HAD-IA family hydrolase [bacterium]
MSTAVLRSQYRHIQIISFDAGFTLIYPDPQVGEVYTHIAKRFGYSLDKAKVHTRFVETWTQMNSQNRGRLKDNAQASEQRSFQWWREIFQQAIGDIISPEDREPLFNACYHAYASGSYWKIYPDVLETLRDLQSRGYRLVILSNWDSRLLRTLRDLKLHTYFEKIYISTLIGHAKPNPGAFLHIVKDLAIPSSALLHVGDTVEEDIAGAVNAHVRSILVKRQADSPFPDRSVKAVVSLRDLVSLLP